MAEVHEAIARDMPEIEQLALLSICDGGPISEALLSKLFQRKLVRSIRRGNRLSPRIEREPSDLGCAVAQAIRSLNPSADGDSNG